VRQLRRDNVAGMGGEDVGLLKDLGVTPDTVEAIVPSYLERYRRAGRFHDESQLA
jgi:NADH dehydrogenase